MSRLRRVIGHAVLALLALACPLNGLTDEPARGPARAWPADLVAADAARANSPAQAREQTAAIRNRLKTDPDSWLLALTWLVDCWSYIEQDGALAANASREGLGAIDHARWPTESARLELCGYTALEYTGDQVGAMAGYNRLVAEAERRGDQVLLAEALRTRAELRGYQGEYADAMTDLSRACPLYEAAGDPREIRGCVQAMAVVRYRAEDYEGSIRLLRQLLPAYEAAGETSTLADVVYNLARAEDGAGRFDAARADYERTMRLCEAIKDDICMAYARYQLGGMLGRAKQPAPALVHLDAAQEAFSRIEDADAVAQIRIERARALIQLRRLDEARAELKRALAEHERDKQLPAIEDGYELLSEIERSGGNNVAALQALQQAFAMHRQLDRASRDRDMTRLRIQYDSEKKEQENRFLLNERSLNEAALADAGRIRRLQGLVLVLAATLLVMAAWVGLRQWRQARAYRLLAMTDELTTISNRRSIQTYLAQQAAEARASQKPLAVVLLDIDHFKKINDRFGHTAGDAVLKRVAQICQGALRNADRIGRTGGEEFLVVLPRTNLHDAREIAERLRVHVETSRFEEWGSELRTQISAGIGLWSAEDRDPMAVVQRADAALYRAKQNGRNRVEVAVHAA
jgi:diguanylate cyclase (GGDEF)-like protein